MKCLNSNCDATEIEKDDKFCYKCGHWTTRGYNFLKNDPNASKIFDGSTIKQSTRVSFLIELFAISFILFFVIIAIRGDNLFKPLYYLKKQINNYSYGYNTTLIKTDNKYYKENITSYEDAIDFIKKDFSRQESYCFNDYEVNRIALKLEKDYSIPSVSFCDMSLEEATKIKDVVEKMYSLFPNIKGALTNITISNAKTKSEYIARFQPMYQFVNINENINDYNKVNKTQILLNSYYFINDDTLSKPLTSTVKKNWYVNDATWESTIAHEFGHYISFLTLLRESNFENITFVSKNNINKINEILNNYGNEGHSIMIINKALDNYNKKYNISISINDFASSISKYAATFDKSNRLIADETIAEAIHDYYLHGDNMQPESKEIVNVIKDML